MSKLMGFKGKLLCAAAGQIPAEDAILKARDVNYKIDAVTDDVSDRGNIHEVVDVAQIKLSLTFELNNDDASALALSIRAAVTTGEGLALRTRDKASGYGVLADWICSLAEDQPLKGAQRMKVEAVPTDRYGRYPAWGT